jgi:2-amino-4-hydroxy-6-hydroxymethyldihydropteridine diphosphokinase
MLEGTLAYIGIGANLDDPSAQCRKAIERLSGVSGIQLERVSSFYRTEPVIPESADGEERKELEKQNWFVNAAVEIRTVLSPLELLKELQHIENSIGRVRTVKGGPRIIDLDLLLYGQEIREEEGLTVPHPEMHRRLFVLEPLCEIASYLIHPVFGVSMRGLKDRLDDNRTVERI